MTPPRIVEKGLSILIPPACREEVLGDLCESCTSSTQYVRESLQVLPMVIFSRIRRTADTQVLLMQAIVLYASFMGSAWWLGQTSLLEDTGLLRLAIPPVCIVFGFVIDDAYAIPGKRSVPQQMRGPLLGFGFVCLSQFILSNAYRSLASPMLTTIYGGVIGLLFATLVKLLFPSIVDRRVGASAPALWLKYVAEPLHLPPATSWIVRDITILLLVAFVASQLFDSSLAAYLAAISVMILLFREVTRRW